MFLRRITATRRFCRTTATADLCLVTSLHDGMNLVAKEFVAARDDEQGALILSRFTGASHELADALVVNPYDTDELAHAIHAALTMPAEETQRAHAADARRGAGTQCLSLGRKPDRRTGRHSCAPPGTAWTPRGDGPRWRPPLDLPPAGCGAASCWDSPCARRRPLPRIRSIAIRRRVPWLPLSPPRGKRYHRAWRYIDLRKLPASERLKDGTDSPATAADSDPNAIRSSIWLLSPTTPMAIRLATNTSAWIRSPSMEKRRCSKWNA